MVFFAAVLRITANYCFHSSNFLRGHVHVGIRWRDFTGASPSRLTSLLTFVCIPQYISFNLHQFSLHIFRCRWCVIYLQFVFIYFCSTSLGQCLTLHSGRFRFPPQIKRGLSLTVSRHTFVTYASHHRTNSEFFVNIVIFSCCCRCGIYVIV